jgi:hypothetical protein
VTGERPHWAEIAVEGIRAVVIAVSGGGDAGPASSYTGLVAQTTLDELVDAIAGQAAVRTRAARAGEEGAAGSEREPGT